MSDKTTNISIGKRIQELRKKNNETQQMLAEVISTQQNNISKIEKGEHSLTLQNMILISEHYNVSLDYLCKGEGGYNLLDTLDKYIRFTYGKISGIADDKKNHPIPQIEINNFFYDYLCQTANANYTSQMPENIRQLWIEQSTKEFNDNIINDKYSKYTSFYLLASSILEENREIIQIIEKHIIE